MSTYHCDLCGASHEGFPAVVFPAPDYYFSVPEGEREERCELTSETCVVDDEHFFVRALLHIPIVGEKSPFVWNLWQSVSVTNFDLFVANWNERGVALEEPMVGYLCGEIPGYLSTHGLVSRFFVPGGGERPCLELQPCNHPLSQDQEAGVSMARAHELYHAAFPEPAGRKQRWGEWWRR